jgi:hypothetical protein
MSSEAASATAVCAARMPAMALSRGTEVSIATCARLALPEWKKLGGPFYLSSARSALGRTEVGVVKEWPGKSIFEIAIVIDLSALFARIDATGVKKE